MVRQPPFAMALPAPTRAFTRLFERLLVERSLFGDCGSMYRMQGPNNKMKRPHPLSSPLNGGLEEHLLSRSVEQVHQEVNLQRNS